MVVEDSKKIIRIFSPWIKKIFIGVIILGWLQYHNESMSKSEIVDFVDRMKELS